MLEVHPAKLWAHIDANKAVREPVLAMSAQLHGWKALSVEKYTLGIKMADTLVPLFPQWNTIQ